MALPFSPDTFDGVLANRLLQHLPNPSAAVREMVRVSRHGATIAIAEPDWDTFAVEPSGGRAGRAIVSLRSAGVANPQVGRDLGSLLSAHGAGDVGVIALDWSVRDYAVANFVFRLEETAERAAAARAVSPDAAAGWVAALRSAANDARFAAHPFLRTREELAPHDSLDDQGTLSSGPITIRSSSWFELMGAGPPRITPL